MNTASFSYIGRRSACGCIVAAVTDQRDKITADAVREFILDGLVLERVPSTTVRELWGCTHRVVQPPLLEAES